MTDVLGAKRMNFRIILVDRLLDIEPLVTKFWRFFENLILKDLNKNNKFKIHEYYDNLK
jgi:predicted HAD superfamily phosphohydrolase YqeG